MEYRINLTDDTVEQLGRVLGEPIQELEQEILDKEDTIKEQQETIAEKDETIAEKQAIIDAFPTIESKSITANGTYSEEGKAYSPVVVSVPQTTVEALSVTQNGTYSEQGKAYSPVVVNVPDSGLKLINGKFKFINNLAQDVFITFPLYNTNRKCMTASGYKVSANSTYDVPADLAIAASGANPSILISVDVDTSLYTVSALPNSTSGTTSMNTSKIAARRGIEITFAPNDGTVTQTIGTITIAPV